ncbi:MAG: hypothetical protein HQ553_06955 [Chloroflexi bacterium]|nr:hypothetical protein [Chloroflexota bacterium]
MVEKLSTKILLLMTVLIPYFVLVAYTIAIYPDLPDELGVGVPKAFIFLPALIVAMLPATYGVMVFFFAHYLKKVHLLTMSIFMDSGTFALIGALYLVKDSS